MTTHPDTPASLPTPPADASALDEPLDELAAWTARWAATRDALTTQVAALNTTTLGSMLEAELPTLIEVYGGDPTDARAALAMLMQTTPLEARRDALLAYWAHAVRIGEDDPAPLLAPLSPAD